MPAAASENTPDEVSGPKLANRRCSEWRAVRRSPRRRSERTEGKPGFDLAEQKSGTAMHRDGRGTAGRRERLQGRTHRPTGPEAEAWCATMNAGFSGSHWFKSGSRKGKGGSPACWRQCAGTRLARCDEHHDAGTHGAMAREVLVNASQRPRCVQEPVTAVAQSRCGSGDRLAWGWQKCRPHLRFSPQGPPRPQIPVQRTNRLASSTCVDQRNWPTGRSSSRR